MKTRRAVMLYLSQEDEQRLKELQDIFETPSVTETMRQVIRKTYKEETKIEKKELTQN